MLLQNWLNMLSLSWFNLYSDYSWHRYYSIKHLAAIAASGALALLGVKRGGIGLSAVSDVAV